MAENVVSLPARDNMTVEECLALSARESVSEKWQDVMVLAYDEHGDLVVRSSHMSRKDALWLLVTAADHARGLS
jgi:hypothetical protein